NSMRVPVLFGFRKGESRGTPRLQKLVNETTVGRDFREVGGLTADRLPEITAPVFALYGQTSPYVRLAQHLTKVLPHCYYDTLPENGHFYLLKDPHTTLARMADFLADPAGSAAAAKSPPGTAYRML